MFWRHIARKGTFVQVKINLGSGFIGLKDWLNYDNSIVARFGRNRRIARFLVALKLLPEGYLDIEWPPIVLHDCRKGLPLADNSVDVVYTSHFFEHLYRHEVVSLLRESMRVLKPGGMIRVVLPDLDKLLAMYEGRDKAPFPGEEVCTDCAYTRADHFVAQFYPGEMNQLVPPSRIQKFQERFLHRHKWMYTFESFAALMRHVGFEKIERKGYRDSAIADAQKLDVLPEVSFYLEAHK